MAPLSRPSQSDTGQAVSSAATAAPCAHTPPLSSQGPLRKGGSGGVLRASAQLPDSQAQGLPKALSCTVRLGPGALSSRFPTPHVTLSCLSHRQGPAGSSVLCQGHVLSSFSWPLQCSAVVTQEVRTRTPSPPAAAPPGLRAADSQSRDAPGSGQGPLLQARLALVPQAPPPGPSFLLCYYPVPQMAQHLIPCAQG